MVDLWFMVDIGYGLVCCSFCAKFVWNHHAIGGFPELSINDDFSMAERYSSLWSVIFSYRKGGTTQIANRYTCVYEFVIYIRYYTLSLAFFNSTAPSVWASLWTWWPWWIGRRFGHVDQPLCGSQGVSASVVASAIYPLLGRARGKRWRSTLYGRM